MNPEKLKFVEVNGRKFAIMKMSAKNSLKVARLLTAKVLPFLDSFMELFKNGDLLDENSEASLDDFLSVISLDVIAEALDKVDDADLDKLINFGLSHCYEVLPAGQMLVLNQNGTYGVSGIDDDAMFTLRLTIEAIAWSVQGFFDASRWTSMFQGMASFFQQNASTLINSTEENTSLPPS